MKVERQIKRGLVIGKFLPIHKGHIALINFALSHCDELIVSMSYTDQDPIDAQLRFNWIKEIFKNEPRIKPNLILDDFDQDELALNVRTAIWADKMREVYPPIHVLVSSEDYGHYFALNLGAECQVYDVERTKTPISATLIRNEPSTHWEFIPSIVQPYFVKKICFYGPESTGKSTVSKKMAELYHTVSVPEVARELIINNDLTESDFVTIGRAQTQRVLDQQKIANRFLFCDTDLITTQIYAQHYLGFIPAELFELEKQITYDQYFLMNIDVDWIADDLRDLGDRRVEMFNIFKQELINRGINFIEIKGDYESRERQIREEIRPLNPLKGTLHGADSMI